MTLPYGLMSPTNPHLSHTQYVLWLKSPEQYRAQYFEGKRFEPTAPMRFGGTVAKLIERNDPNVCFVPRLQYPEHEIRTVIAGVPTLSYLDSFDMHPFRVLEYKTSKNPWTQEMVEQSTQLLFYAAAVRAAYGALPASTHLVWLRTKTITAVIDERGIVWEEIGGDGVVLSGEAQIFPRIITAEEADAFEVELRRVAEEISEEWERYEAASK